VSIVSDTYPNGLAVQLVGDSLVIVWSGSDVSQPTTFQAVFDIARSTVPEPSTAFPTGIAVLAGLVAWGLRRWESSRRP
jgi:hypothetical protein